MVAAGCYTKLKCLLNHMEAVQRKGLIALSDQQAAARRTWQEVNSPEAPTSARRLMDKEARIICWRDRQAEQGQAQLTLTSLRKALSRAKLEVEETRIQALHNLAGGQFSEVERKIRVLSVRMRRKEKGRSRCKIINLEKREKSCPSHQISRWVRRYQRQHEGDKCHQEEMETQMDPTSGIRRRRRQ